MSIAECRNNPCWLLCRVYDDHQPMGRSGFALEEPLSIGPSLRFAVVGQLKRVKHRLQMRLKLGVALVRIQDCSSHVSSKSTTRNPSGVRVSTKIGRSLITASRRRRDASQTPCSIGLQTWPARLPTPSDPERPVDNRPPVQSAHSPRSAESSPGPDGASTPQKEPCRNHGNRSWPQPRHFCNGRYWARTSDLRLVEAALSQLS